MKLRAIGYWIAYAVLLLAATVAGLEFLSSFVAPTWPARELRPVEVPLSQPSSASNAPNPRLTYNSWLMRDWERTVAKPSTVDFRTVLIGDSFLEGGFVSRPLPAQVEEYWPKTSRPGSFEAINLGVSATDPNNYYYRIKNVALALQPDAMVVVFYSGNDFVHTGHSPWTPPPFLAERPLPSWLGMVAPRLTWLTVNRLRTSQFGRRSNESEFEDVNRVLTEPLDRRYDALARFMKRNYFPNDDVVQIRRVFERGGDKFWEAFEKREHDQEHLQGWWVAGLYGWETQMNLPATITDKEIQRSIDPEQFKATLSWLTGARDLARQNNMKFMVAMAPAAGGDPAYVEFWKPWPRYRAFQIQREAWHRAFRPLIEGADIQVVDLAEDLRGVSGTYRLSDAHWTELGTSLAAKRIASELVKLRDSARR